MIVYSIYIFEIMCPLLQRMIKSRLVESTLDTSSLIILVYSANSSGERMDLCVVWYYVLHEVLVCSMSLTSMSSVVRNYCIV